MVKLTGYFTITWLAILIVSFLVYRFLLIKLLGFDDDSNEWWMVIITGVSFIFSLKFVFFLTLSSVTIFLNLFKKIRNNWFLSLLTYSLIPIGAFLSIGFGNIFEFEAVNSDLVKSDLKFSACIVLPHLVCTFFVFYISGN